MATDPLDSILYVVAGISIASGMPHPETLKRQSGFLFFWYSWLFAACQSFAQNAGRISPQLGAIQQKTETTISDARGVTRTATSTTAIQPAQPAAKE